MAIIILCQTFLKSLRDKINCMHEPAPPSPLQIVTMPQNGYESLNNIGKNICLALTEIKINHSLSETRIGLELINNIEQCAQEAKYCFADCFQRIISHDAAIEKKRSLYSVASKKLLGTNSADFLVSVGQCAQKWSSLKNNQKIEHLEDVEYAQNFLLQLRIQIHDFKSNMMIAPASLHNVNIENDTMQEKINLRLKLLEVQKNGASILACSHHSELQDKLKIIQVEETEIMHKMEKLNKNVPALNSFVCTDEMIITKRQKIEDLLKEVDGLINSGHVLVAETYKIKETISKQVDNEIRLEIEGANRNMDECKIDIEKRIVKLYEEAKSYQDTLQKSTLSNERLLIDNLHSLNAVDKLKISQCYRLIDFTYMKKKVEDDYYLIHTLYKKLKNIL